MNVILQKKFTESIIISNSLHYVTLILISLHSAFHINMVVSNHVNSDHVLSFSCLDVCKARQTASGVYAITNYYCDNVSIS